MAPLDGSMQLEVVATFSFNATAPPTAPFGVRVLGGSDGKGSLLKVDCLGMRFDFLWAHRAVSVTLLEHTAPDAPEITRFPTRIRLVPRHQQQAPSHDPS